MLKGSWLVCRGSDLQDGAERGSRTRSSGLMWSGSEGRRCVALPLAGRDWERYCRIIYVKLQAQEQ